MTPKFVPTAILLLLFCCLPVLGQAVELSPFTSDGCSLFPDGTVEDRTMWCDCCLTHDVAYWQGGTEEERLAADEGLRNCVLKTTGNEALATAMFLGVRAGGSPAFPTWYRWGYGWPYGRGYQTLSAAEQRNVREQLGLYLLQHPDGYCAGRDQTVESGGERPTTWATPVPSEHLDNFYRLDAKVYRGAQPDEAGFEELQDRGIRNILSFREYHADHPENPADFKLDRVKMAAGSITTEQVVESLRIIKRSEGPVLLHCWHGSDRTGMVSAMYRIVFQGWSKEEAIDELVNGGYGHHAWLYRNIPEFIREAEIEAIRTKVLAP